MQTYQRQNFLNVGFDPCRGLKLNWNFKDLTSTEHYFRHIFVIFSQKSKESLHILESLYKKMKYGDLFCCIYAHDTYIYKVGKWVEKSQLNSFKFQRYLREMSNRNLDQYLKGKLVDGAGKEALQFEESVVIHFLGIKNAQLDFFRNEIIKRRYSNKGYQYLVNFFGDFQSNKICVHSGINQFKTNVPNFSDHAQYCHKIINSAAIQSAKIQLTAMNGELSLFNEAHWRDMDFDRIGGTYYGPSSSYEFDSIYFYNRDQMIDTEHEFQLKLQVKLFNNKVLESVKRIKINFFHQREYHPTFHNSRGNYYYPQKNICLSQNPYKCQLIVKYKLQKDEKYNKADIQV